MSRLNARWNNFTARGQTWDHFWQDAAPQTYTFTGDVALTFPVSSPQAATYAEPVSIALTFGVDSPFEFIEATPAVDYSVTGDVTLSFGVNSAFEYVAAPAVVVTPPAVSRSVRYYPAQPWTPAPRIRFTWIGSAAMPAWKVASPMSVTHAPPAAAVARRGRAPVMMLAVSHAPPAGVSIRRALPVAALQVRTEQIQVDELLLVGAL